jgi:hypothetical protein
LSAPGAEPRRPRREILLASVFFLAVTILMTWPQAARMSDAMLDVWDGKLNLRILHWDWYQTLRDPRNLFQLPIFHPARDALAFSENLYGAALFGFPLLSAGASPVTNYNALFLLGMFLSAVSAWALARHVTGDPLASVAAGLVYAFVPWRISQFPHLQYQWGAFLCLLLLFLLRFMEGGRARDLAAFGVFFAWNLLTNVYYGIFSGILVLVAVGVAAAWRPPRRAAASVGAMALATAACAPFLIPYVRMSKTYGVRRGLTEVLFYSGRWTDFLSAGGGNRLYGTLLSRWDAPEGFFFPGVVAPLLAAAALVGLSAGREAPSRPPAGLPPSRLRAARVLDALIVVAAALAIASWRNARLHVGPVSVGDPERVVVVITALVVARLAAAFPGRRKWTSLADWLRRAFLDPRAALFGALGVAGILVALGAHTPYYTFLFQSFGFAFRAIRAPSRGIVLFHIALAVLAAWGLSLWTRGRGRRLASVALAAGLLLLEYRAFPVALHPVDPEPPAVYRWVATLQPPSPIVEWPLGPHDDFDYLFRQTAHERPLLNGYSGFFPPAYDRLAEALGRRPIPDDVWDSIEGLGARVLIYHPAAVEPGRRGAYRVAVRRALERGRITLLRSFANAAQQDFAFRIGPAARESAAGPDARSRALLDRFLAVAEDALSPPVVGIVFPDPVRPGDWRGGWAVDDSGVAEIRIASELGPAGLALLHMRHPGLAAAFPDIAEAADDRAGFGFPFPNLPPGPHTLTIRVVANDGGVTVVTSPVVVLPAKK